MTAYRALTAAGVTTRAAAELTGVARATAGRDKTAQDAAAVTDVSLRRATRPVPANRLTDSERDRVLAVLNSTEFVDRTPVQVHGTLLDRGEYVCSVSTMYRVLADHAQVQDRRRQARHPARVRPELIATGPGEVFSWDMPPQAGGAPSKLRGPVKGSYFDAYVMIDIYSRYIVGACVHTPNPLCWPRK